MKVLTTLAIIACLALAACQQPSSQQTGDQAQTDDNPLAGAWRITEASVTSPDTSYTDTDPQPGLYLFLDRHYSTLLVPGPERASFTDETTDAEMLAAYENFIANTGTYTVSDSTLTLQHIVTKFPNVMSDTLTYTYQVEGNTLRLTLSGVAWAEEGEIQYTLARVE